MDNIKNEINLDLPLFSIGAFAKLLNVHQATLRIYDKEGILSPKRTKKNRRHYCLADYEKGKLILFLTRNLALNLSGVKLILTLLEENKIRIDKQLEFIVLLAKKAKISQEEQEVNIQKTSSRGRKPKNLSDNS